MTSADGKGRDGGPGEEELAPAEPSSESELGWSFSLGEDELGAGDSESSEPPSAGLAEAEAAWAELAWGDGDEDLVGSPIVPRAGGARGATGAGRAAEGKGSERPPAQAAPAVAAGAGGEARAASRSVEDKAPLEAESEEARPPRTARKREAPTASAVEDTRRKPGPPPASAVEDTRRKPGPPPTSAVEDTRRRPGPPPTSAVEDTRRRPGPPPTSAVEDTRRRPGPPPASAVEDTRRRSGPPPAGDPRPPRRPAARAPSSAAPATAPDRPEVEAGRPRPAAGAEGAPSAMHQIGARASTGTRGAPALLGRAAAPIVGMDFGTTYSKVAVFDAGEVVLIEDTAGRAATRAAVPSVVAYLKDGTAVVGEPARELLATEPRSVIGSVKRVLGLGYSDPLANGLLGSLACEHVQGPNDSILFRFRGQTVTVPEIAARMMEHLARMAGRWAGCKVTKAVMTVPVDFDARARRDFELATRMAGIEVVALVPEPVAAAMGCGFDGLGGGRIAIYDFGGGTFDASVVEVGQNRFVVRGSAGDRWLGGDDFDELLARHVADGFQSSTGVSLHGRAEEWQRLLFACEEAKRWLSTLSTVDVILPEAARTADGPKTLLETVSREDFEEASEDIVTSSLEVCRQALAEAEVAPADIDALLVTGGTTRIPAVREAAQRFFGRKGLEGVHPEHAVVIGAAVHAAVMSGLPVPEDFAERLRGLGRVERTIGIALADGTTEQIIEGSRRPPVAAHRLYSTSRDGQTRVRIELVEGSARNTVDNRRIGGFVIDGLPAARSGAITLDVYFELSSTGTLYVTAQERSTGRRAQGSFDL